ncbi:MAG: hypothetical protein DMD35_02165 [Gemmatimonadetes bacterium]|nr:MAG: hypothetical protein DMD35_02165 [Gemmatimonadota bacterium]
MTRPSISATLRPRVTRARVVVRAEKRAGATGSACMRIPIAMRMCRIRGCRPGMATRPGDEEQG